MPFPEAYRAYCNVASGGFGMNSVHRLLATSDRSNYLSSVPLALSLSTVGDPNASSDTLIHFALLQLQRRRRFAHRGWPR